MRLKFCFLWTLALIGAFQATGQDRAHISIRGSGAGKSSITLSGLQTDGSEAARVFRNVLKDNLQRSGWFQVVEGDSAGIRVRGRLQGGSGFSANVRTEWLPTGAFDWSRMGSANDARSLAHELNDEIVNKITGRKGMASAPILMVGRRGSRTDVYICDADGGRLRAITPDGKICLSPKWLPDRSGFFYTAFLRGFGESFRVTLGERMRREAIASYPGLNMGAVASPDGSLAALILSAGGKVDLYVMNLKTRRLTKRTDTPHASESSPCWSPDGLRLAYVSDSDRSPQVYAMHRDEREGRRLVYGLNESVSPDWGADGRIAFSGRQAGRYRIFVMSGSGGAFEAISPADGNDYEEPSWAPDSRHIIATRSGGGRKRLVILDTMGDAPVQLHGVDGDWFLADWAK